MIIRKASKEDAKELNWLLTLLIRDEKQYDDTIDENFVVTNMYENYIDDQNRCIKVAEENNKIVGYIYGYFKESDPTSINKMAVLDALYIDENFRKKGIANHLINEFKEWCIKNNVDTIEVGVCSQNTKAKQLYNKHDFITTREIMIFEVK